MTDDSDSKINEIREKIYGPKKVIKEGLNSNSSVQKRTETRVYGGAGNPSESIKSRLEIKTEKFNPQNSVNQRVTTTKAKQQTNTKTD